MCSNPDLELDEDGVTFMKEQLHVKNLKWCRKCTTETEANVVLRKKDAYCKACFLLSVTHKFRACLGKSKLMKPGDKVLIGYSGSTNSNTLLHLINSGLQESSHKKLMFQPFIIYIDESAVLNLTHDESEALEFEINNILEKYSFPIYRVPLALSILPEDALEVFLANGDKFIHNGTLNELFSSLKSETAKIDMLNKLRYTLLVRTAKWLDCGKVFTAQSADDLAVTLLTNISLGRGSQLPYDVGFSDCRTSVKVIRPLRDISKKELTFYCIFNKLTTIHVPSLSTKLDTQSSIQKLTETFLCELQDGFPSTLSTVFRVADKLSPSSSNQNTCPLCKTQKDSEDAASSSLNATKFSRMVASLGPTNYNADALAPTSLDNECSEICGDRTCCSQSLAEELQEILCYGCYLILKDADLKAIPHEFLRHQRDSSQRFKMKKEIEQFLL